MEKECEFSAQGWMAELPNEMLHYVKTDKGAFELTEDQYHKFDKEIITREVVTEVKNYNVKSSWGEVKARIYKVLDLK